MADWEDAPVKTSEWEDAPKQVAPVPGRQEERQKQATKRLGPQDILGKTGESAGYGAVLGAISPELTMGAGGLMLGFPMTAPFAPAVISTGEAMRGARLAEAGLGFLSGGATEFTEDVSKQAGASTGVSKALGFGAGMTPYALPSVVKGIASKLTGISKESIRELVDKLPKTIESIEAGTETQKQKAKQVAVDLLKKAGATDKDLQPLYDIFYGAAKDIEGKGKAALSQAEGEANRLTKLAEQSGRAEDWQKAVPQLKSAVGQPRELSEIGTSLREPIVANNQAALAKRSADYKTLETTRDQVLAQKEAAGEFIENSADYKQLVGELEKILRLSPEGKAERAAQETDPGVKKAFQDLYNALKPQPEQLTAAQVKDLTSKGFKDIKTKTIRVLNEETGMAEDKAIYYRDVHPSFNAIDTIRRRVGDAAFGRETEGYPAIKGNLAQDWYFKLSKMQENFAGESQKALQNTYKEHSGWLDKYKAQLGKRVTALDRFDETKFAADAKSLPDSFFSSQQSVRDLLQLTNDKNLVNKAASDYAARSVGETVESAQAFKKKNSEMLKELPDVARKVDNYIQQLQRGELAVSKGEARAKQFTEQGKEVLEKGTQQAKDAQAIADKLLGDKFPAERIKQFLQTGSPQEWERIAPYIAQTPQGKDVLAKGLAAALGDEISGLAVTKSGSIGAIFKDKIAPGLRATKLMDEKKINLIESQLKRIYESNQTPAAKQSLATKLIANAVRGQAATGLTAGTDFIFNLNQTGK
jgi:uncharacterized spore protein YtfJ